MENYQNIGLLFYKHYFKGIDFKDYPDNSKEEKEIKKEVEKENERLLKEKNESIFSSVLNINNIPHISNQLRGFNLVTCYPGLFTGSGYMHEASELGELKLGFYFDHTSGLPCIAGSSVKGVLHNAFKHWEYIIEMIAELANLTRYSKQPEIFKGISLNEADIEELINEIFGTEDTKKSIYKRDLFFDSFPVSTDSDNHFLKNDFITPHKNIKNPDLDPFTNPTPLQFLKILPKVEFRFNFKLTDSEKLTAKMKKEIFQQILLDLGIGAKTNVGYGQFELNKEDMLKEKHEGAEVGLTEPERNTAEEEASKTETEKRVVSGVKLKCKVVEITDREVFFMFDWDSELKFKKKRMRFKDITLKENDIVEIVIIEDFYTCRRVLFSNDVRIVTKD